MFTDYVTMAEDGGKVIILKHRPLFTPRKHSRYSFLVKAESTLEIYAFGRIMSMKNSNDIIWKRTSDLPICSTAP
jgi:hypothetical protein